MKTKIILFSLLSFGFLFMLWEILSWFFFIPQSPSITSKIVFLEPHWTAHQVAQVLEKENVILSARSFEILTRVTRKEHLLKPGEFLFEIPSPPWKALQTIVRGQVVLHKITIPEGLNIEEVTQILARENLVEPKAFQPLLSNRDLLKTLNIPAPTFEGFLFPDTYYFSKVDPPEKIVKAMVRRFWQAISKEDEEKAQKFGLSLLQWITLASIIEKESGTPHEQPIISSVFHNRLRKKMRLQSDPTVIYGIKNFNGDLTKKDLQTDTPYNTYRRFGLPPGPIANPGSTAIHAAVNPISSPFLFFVATKEGPHIFSERYSDHSRAVDLHQRSNLPPSTLETPTPTPLKKISSKKTKPSSKKKSFSPVKK